MCVREINDTERDIWCKFFALSAESYLSTSSIVVLLYMFLNER